MPASRHRTAISWLIVLLCLALALAACDSSASTSAATATPLPPTATSQPTATPIPGPYGGTLAFLDPLTVGNLHQWDEFSNITATCQFGATGYHVLNAPNYGVNCYMREQTYGDFAFQVKMSFTQGTATDHGGIVFRTNGEAAADGYEYSMRADGRYDLIRCRPHNCDVVLASGMASGFAAGLHVSNQLGVVAHGSTISFYVNGHLLSSVTDSGFATGYLGVQNNSNNGGTQSEVIYTDAELWLL